jgi:hypothetical protein
MVTPVKLTLACLTPINFHKFTWTRRCQFKSALESTKCIGVNCISHLMLAAVLVLVLVLALTDAWQWHGSF